jgi:diguanylate cyclase (GGDEF)-like protein
VLRTIRAKFAALLLLGLAVVGGAVAALDAAPGRAESIAQAAQPAFLIGMAVTLAVMLLIERVVIAPIRRLSRNVLSAASGSPGDPGSRLPEEGPDEVAMLARTFNGLIDNLAAKQKLEAQLVHMAHHDALTGLPNRLLFREKLNAEVARARRGECLAVLCLDLDHFKSVNDTLGHPAGDALLRAVSVRMRECARETDIVARLGGDEFAIVQVAAEQPGGAIRLSERLIAAIADPFDIAGQQVAIGTSIGIALAPLDSLDTEQLIKSADMALYRAKTDGRGLYRFFETEMDARMQARRTLELDLRAALLKCEFEVFYQPLIDLQSNSVCGFEALLRWNHPTRGLVSPCEFIPLAEELGLIVPLGEWVLRQACCEAVKWPSNIKVAVNLSPAQFKSKGLVLAVTAALAASGLSPRRLELEITESVLLLESESTLATLHELRDLGVRISMDDFGTGYSSLSYLRSFPFDKIKIDQSFVRDLSEKQGSIAIVRAVSGLGRNLGMATTAEGVETEEQLGQLRGEGCTEVQGYLFSKPMPATSVVGLIEQIRRQLHVVEDAPLVYRPNRVA